MLLFSRNSNKRIKQKIKRLEMKELYIKEFHEGPGVSVVPIPESSDGHTEASNETTCPIDTYTTVDLGAIGGDINEYEIAGVYRTIGDDTWLRLDNKVWIAEVFEDTTLQVKVFNDLDISVEVTIYWNGPGTGETTIVTPLFLGVDIEDGNITLGTKDDITLIDAGDGAIVVTLPPADTSLGKVLTVKKTDAEVNTVTVDGDGTETIDGELTYVLQLQYDTITIISDGSNWYILNEIDTGI